MTICKPPNRTQPWKRTFAAALTLLGGSPAHAAGPSEPLETTQSDSALGAPQLDAAPRPEPEEGKTQTQRHGFYLGGGLAGAVPRGHMAAGGLPFEEAISSAVLGNLEWGYRSPERISVGAYVGGGAAIINKSGALAACQYVDCSAGLFRVGVLARYNFATRSLVEPWVGVGTGYEWFRLGAEDVELQAKGPELVQLRGGVDIWNQHNQNLQLFVGYSMGRYSRVALNGLRVGGASADHYWVSFGATYNFSL